jgi:hypothetical protein
MTQVAKPGNADAAKRADADIFKKYPDRKSKPLTMSPADAALRAEWLVLYERYGGQVVHRNGPKAPISKQRKRVEVQTAPLGVYVYIVKMAGDDPWGHVGLILQQPDRSYIRYSQAADNPNLQGTDRWEYCTWQQDVRVRQVKFARGTDVKTIIKGASIIRIPTKHADKVQKAVTDYIEAKSSYHVITNNCADFVNDALNAADDVSIPDATIPTTYFAKLTELFPGNMITGL